jgi:hypothetical protein
MRVSAAVTGAILVLAFTGTPGHAGLPDDVARCAAIADGGERLACFDGLAATAKTDVSALTPAAADALKREFRFDSRLMTGPFSFRLAVSGDLKISRPTAAAREVENLVRRVGKALADSEDWGVVVTVHGAQITFSRGNPYTGAELLAQAQAGMVSLQTNKRCRRHAGSVGRWPRAQRKRTHHCRSDRAGPAADAVTLF